MEIVDLKSLFLLMNIIDICQLATYYLRHFMRLRLMLIFTLFFSLSASAESKSAFCGQVLEYHYYVPSRKHVNGTAEITFVGEGLGYWVEPLSQYPNNTTAEKVRVQGVAGKNHGDFIALSRPIRSAQKLGQRICISYPAGETSPAIRPVLVTKVQVGVGSDDLSILRKMLGEL